MFLMRPRPWLEEELRNSMSRMGCVARWDLISIFFLSPVSSLSSDLFPLSPLPLSLPLTLSLSLSLSPFFFSFHALPPHPIFPLCLSLPRQHTPPSRFSLSLQHLIKSIKSHFHLSSHSRGTHPPNPSENIGIHRYTQRCISQQQCFAIPSENTTNSLLIQSFSRWREPAAVLHEII